MSFSLTGVNDFDKVKIQCRRSSVVEQLIRNQQVGGSIPLAGSI